MTFLSGQPGLTWTPGQPMVNRHQNRKPFWIFLATIDMDRKLGNVPLIEGGGELLPHLTQRCLDWGLTPYKVASWSIQPFGHNRHWPKIGCGYTETQKGQRFDGIGQTVLQTVVPKMDVTSQVAVCYSYYYNQSTNKWQTAIYQLTPSVTW